LLGGDAIGRGEMSRKFDDEARDALEVVIPNLNWRYSGGTAVNRTIAPLIAKRWRAAWCGPDQPEGIRALSLGDLVRLRFRPPTHGKVRIWHARRNVEMLAGLFLNLIGYRFALIFNSASQRKKTWLTHFLIARMDAVIATSAIAAQFLRRPATVILHGVDTDLYAPPADRLAAFAQTGLPGKYGIGTFGRVRKQKGSDLFVEAMRRLLPKYPDFCAVVVGLTTVDNRPFVEGLKQQIAAAGLTERIRFLGELPVQEVPLWFQRISIYVFASRVEGFGLTMLEAMAAGDAVVATRAGAAEMIITDGDDGVLAPVDDVEALVAALEPLMREPERIEAMGGHARARVVSAFSRDREADEISDVYRQVWAMKAPLARRPSPTGEGRG
jgi:mannosyltransferase